ncbi:DUF4350 domain-containing protein [Salinigranum marinum]|uniref:DUF4350 domain-containing protein n=1 Tax=Salinigranum marinum TaxID=1515595 RepID=UPI002989B9F2|nr:DUF4350 domain-containing protein [Salinigranum marinum]
MNRETLPPRAALALFAVVLLLAATAGATTSPTTYSAYNSDWDGTSELRLRANAAAGDQTVAAGTRAYRTADAKATVAVVVAPTEPYTAGELATVRSFVTAGGTLVVAADSAAANRLLDGVGAAARVDGRPLRDERAFFRTAALPVVRDIRDDPLTEGVDELVFNHPTAVEPNGARVLAATSGFAYLDTERNAVLDLEEELRSYPVVTTERIGDGRVVVVSDPSLFLNGMLDRSDNARFADNVVSADEHVILDFSHGATVPPFVVAVDVLQHAPLLQALVLVGGVGVVAGWVVVPGIRARRRGRARRPTPLAIGDESTLRASLRRAHPDWDEANVDRVAMVVARRMTDARRDERDVRGGAD